MPEKTLTWDSNLTQVMNEGKRTTIFLQSGVGLTGFIIDYDDVCIQFAQNRDGSEACLVRHDAIASVSPI